MRALLLCSQLSEGRTRESRAPISATNWGSTIPSLLPYRVQFCAGVGSEHVIAFEILINGTRYGESEEITAVTVVADQVAGRQSERVTVHGQSVDGRIQWLDSHLATGDEILIRISEARGFGSDAPIGCNFCGREVPDVVRLIQGRSVAICDSCTKRFAESLKFSRALPVGTSIHDDPTRGCEFCGQHGHDVGGLLVRNDATICPGCVRSCEDLFAE